MRLMIVDDHGLFRGGLVSLFKSQPDFDVVGEASTLKDALDQLETAQPDLILLDLGLPDGSSLESLSKLFRKLPDVRIVFLTIHASDENAFKALRQGAHGFLLKDIEGSKLINALRGVERGELAVSRAVLSRFVIEIRQITPSRQGKATGLQAALTPRELEVLAELTTDDSNRSIAGRLSISENTLKVHVHNILNKLELGNRKEAADLARRHGFQPRGQPR